MRRAPAPYRTGRRRCSLSGALRDDLGVGWMKLWISADSDWRTYTGRILSEIGRIEPGYSERDYGASVTRVSMILMCREPELNFRQRHRFSEGKGEYYTDIMLDYGVMLAADMHGRMSHVVEQIGRQLEVQLAKRTFEDFDVARFLRDIRRDMQRVQESYDGHGSGPWKY